MPDKRAYFKVDVGYMTNPKVASLLDEAPYAVILHLAATGYAAQHLTDGSVPWKLLLRITGASTVDADRLEAAGLWHRGSHACLGCPPVKEGEAYVHDYLEHQRSSSEVKGAVDRARRAADARWAADADAPSTAGGNAPSMPDALPEGEQGAMLRERGEKEKKDVPRRDVEALCDRLADRIAANGSKRPTIGKTWRDEARRLIDLDGHDPEKAARLIDWCQADKFWRANILSMPKFREKYDQLRLQAIADWEKNGAATHHPDGQIDVDAVLGAERFTLPKVPEGLEAGTLEYQRWMQKARDDWRDDRERRAREVLARREAS